MPENVKPIIEIYADWDALSRAAAGRFAQAAQAAALQRGRFLVCLCGGSTPLRTYHLLAQLPYRDSLPWEKTVFFWGDERMVPPDHPESNYAQAHLALLNRIAVREEHVHRIQGELPPAQAARAYADLLQLWAEPGLSWPRFDLLLLGMGADGHIASLFPGQFSESWLNSPVLSVREQYQDRPADRVTLTPAVFNSTRQMIFLVAGSDKADALAAVFEKRGVPQDWPARLIQPQDGEVAWMVDAAAAEKFQPLE